MFAFCASMRSELLPVESVAEGRVGRYNRFTRGLDLVVGCCNEALRRIDDRVEVFFF